MFKDPEVRLAGSEASRKENRRPKLTANKRQLFGLTLASVMNAE